MYIFSLLLINKNWFINLLLIISIIILLMKSPLYYKTCKILEQYFNNKESKNYESSNNNLKTIIYNYTDSSDKYFKKIFCLSIEVVKNNNVLNNIIDNVFVEEDYQQFNISNIMMKVLIYEIYISSYKFKMGGKLIKYIKSHDEYINKILKDNKYISNIDDYNTNNKTNKIINKTELIKNNKIYFRLLDYSINEHKKLKNELKKEYINEIAVKDSLVKGLYYLKNSDYEKEKINLFKLRDSNFIKIQSKSSSLPVFILYKAIKEGNLISNIKNNYKIIDTCAAPGNKTLQLVDYFITNQINNSSSNCSAILAFDNNNKRFNTLQENVYQASNPNIIGLFNNLSKKHINNYNDVIILNNEDFLSYNPKEEINKDVKVILCDPSCTGSGTFNNTLENKELSTKCCLELISSNNNEDVKRLNKLSSFQMKVVLHSMKFKNVEVISYSTCSIYKEENEDVIEKILESDEGKNFELLDIHKLLNINSTNDSKEITNKIGIEKEVYHNGITSKTKNCLRVCKLCTKLDGFFVALFKRKN